MEDAEDHVQAHSCGVCARRRGSVFFKDVSGVANEGEWEADTVGGAQVFVSIAILSAQKADISELAERMTAQLGCSAQVYGVSYTLARSPPDSVGWHCEAAILMLESAYGQQWQDKGRLFVQMATVMGGPSLGLEVSAAVEAADAVFEERETRGHGLRQQLEMHVKSLERVRRDVNGTLWGSRPRISDDMEARREGHVQFERRGTNDRVTGFADMYVLRG